MQPFAGIYASEMLPNNDALDLEQRLEQLAWAVKRVYASTFSQEAQQYASPLSNCRLPCPTVVFVVQPFQGGEGQTRGTPSSPYLP